MHCTEQTLPGRADSVAKVRAWARDYWTCHGAAQTAVQDAVLVLSELASNAVRHTRSGRPHGLFTVVLGSAAWLRVEVTDAGSRTVPMARRVDPLDWAARGRGLALVDALAARWQVTGDHRSWTVAAEIAAAGQRMPEPP